MPPIKKTPIPREIDVLVLFIWIIALFRNFSQLNSNDTCEISGAFKLYYDVKEVRLYEKSSRSGSLLSAASRN